jgi:DNA-directed RNA polymerase specialized sigma24 family protein
MRLREKEFLQARALLLPVLIKKFHKYVKLAKVQKARTEYAKDLAHETIAQALRNNMNPMYDHISSVDLIKMKAKNVWVDDWRKRQRSVSELPIDPIEFEWKNGEIPESQENKPLTFERLMELATAQQAEILNLRLEKYQVNEIAARLGSTPAAITMQIQRLKMKFFSRRW